VLVLTLIVAAFAAARLARLIAEDDLTVGFRRAIINRFGTDTLITKLVHCAPWCMSMWFSVLLPVAVFWPNQWVLAAFSIPAGSMAAAIFLRMADRE
jgi:hypothetical protein